MLILFYFIFSSLFYFHFYEDFPAYIQIFSLLRCVALVVVWENVLWRCEGFVVVEILLCCTTFFFRFNFFIVFFKIHLQCFVLLFHWYSVSPYFCFDLVGKILVRLSFFIICNYVVVKVVALLLLLILFFSIFLKLFLLL